MSEHSSFALLHQIFVLDAYLEEALDTGARTSITERFVDDALGVLGLEPLGPLGIYPALDERAPGWSFIQPITTSHISAHYFERPGDGPHIRIDAYSCDRIDWPSLLGVCHRHFRLADWRGTFVDREIDGHRPRPITDLSGRGELVTASRTLEPPATVTTPVAAA